MDHAGRGPHRGYLLAPNLVHALTRLAETGCHATLGQRRKVLVDAAPGGRELVEEDSTVAKLLGVLRRPDPGLCKIRSQRPSRTSKATDHARASTLPQSPRSGKAWNRLRDSPRGSSTERVVFRLVLIRCGLGIRYVTLWEVRYSYSCSLLRFRAVRLMVLGCDACGVMASGGACPTSACGITRSTPRRQRHLSPRSTRGS